MHRKHGAFALRAKLLAGVGAAIACAAPALAQSASGKAETYVEPYLEVDQVVTAPLKGGGDVLTYTDVQVGVDAAVRTRRVEAQISGEYEHRFGESGHIGDSDIISGIARARVEVVPGNVSIEGGALASRANDDFGNGFKGLKTQDSKNVSKVYAAYVAPSVQKNIGEVTAQATYRLGYVKVDDSDDRVFTGQDRFNHAVEQEALAKVGMDPEGSLPFGWNIAGQYRREDLGRLKQRFVQETVIGEVVVPVSSTFAVLGDVGYEKITNSQQSILFDPNTGLPVVSSSGRFVRDPAGGRITFYKQSGVVYEGGFIWHPSRRTRLEARAGHRYGGTTVTAAFDHSFSPAMAFHAEVFDTIDSFGRGLTTGLAALPTSFLKVGSPLLAGGCVFGTKPGSGQCLNAYGLIGTANFRNRGVFAVLSGSRGRTEFGAGIGYSNRRFLAGRNGVQFDNDHAVDQSYIAEAYFMRKLTSRSSLRGDLFAGRYTSNSPGVNSLWTAGATLDYTRLLMPHLEGKAEGGLFASDGEGSGNSDIEASLLLGLRHSF
jgi:hypothetical protein